MSTAPRLQGLPPVLGPGTRRLVLGSFSRVASLQAQQHYAYPQNQFWKILGALWVLPLPAWPHQQCVAAQRAIAHNGGASWRHARHTRALGVPVERLPSTSPAYASWSLARTTAAWAEVLARHGIPVHALSQPTEAR